MTEFDRVVVRILSTGVYELSPAEVKLWRASQPGAFPARHGQICPGWSQAKAAAWLGVTERAWRRFESPTDPPMSRWHVKRVIEYSQSLDQRLDAIIGPAKGNTE